jgi:hypothetical protein
MRIGFSIFAALQARAAAALQRVEESPDSIERRTI